MSNGYSEIYGTVASQRKQIAERRSQLDKPILGGTAKQRRILMRRVRKTPKYRKHVEAKKEQLSALGEAEVELGEHEAKVKEYESEGYKVSKTDEGYQFTKYVKGKRVQVGTKPRSVKITWMEKGSKVHTVGVKGSRRSGFAARLQREFPGATITKVTTVGGGALYKTEAGHWSTKDIILAEAKPIYTTGKIDVDKFKIENPQLAFLLSHAGPKQSELLGRTITSKKPEILRDIEFQVASQKAYKSLTGYEKVQYGIQFQPFKEEPVEEWKYHPGGLAYLKSLPKKEQDVLAKQFILSGRYEVTTGQFAREWLYEGKIFDKDSSLYTSEITGVDISARKHAWEQIIKTPEQIRTTTYEAMPQSLRIGTTYLGAFTKFAVYPITVPQMIVKYSTGTGGLTDPFGRIQTGKTLLLPDVSAKLEKVFPYYSSGYISVGVSEGIGFVTGKESDAWKLAQKYPVETFFGTVGEVAGLYAGGKGISALKRAVIKTKYFGKVYEYPRITKIVDSPQGRYFEGIVTIPKHGYYKTILGKRIPGTTVTRSGTAAMRGAIAKQTLRFVDKDFSGVWQKGQIIYEVGTGVFKQTRFGHTVSKIYTGGGIYTSYPSRHITVAMGKPSIDIQPYVQHTDIGMVYTAKPKMTLTLSKGLLKKDLFKADVAGAKYYPMKGFVETKKGMVTTKSVTQMWELAEDRAVMSSPYLEKVKTQFFEEMDPKIISKYGLTQAEAYGFAPRAEHKIFISSLVEVEKPGEWIFGKPKAFGEGDISTVMRHELTHRKVPWATELETRALTRPKFPSKQLKNMQQIYENIQDTYYKTGVYGKGYLPDELLTLEYATRIDIPTLKKMHKITQPLVRKEVKEFWKTGELPSMEFGAGKQVYQLTPFRQFSISKGPKGAVTYSRTFGMSAVLKGIKLQDIITSEGVSAFSKTGVIPSVEQVLHPPIHKVIVEEPFVITPPHVEFPVFKTIHIPKSILAVTQKISQVTKQRTDQIETLKPITLSNMIQSSLSRTRQMQTSISLQTLESASLKRLVQVQQQMQQSISKTVSVTVPITITTTVPPPPLPMWFDLPSGKPKKQKKKKPVDEYGLGYRERRWKVPTMKQIIGINNKYM